MNVRPFERADTARLIEVLAAVFGEYGMRFDPDGFDGDVKDVPGRYAPPRGVFFTVEDEGELLGFGGADLPRDEIAEIHRLYIDPRARGRGIGALLCQTIEQWARERAQVIELWSDVRFFHAHELYSRRGYRLFGQRMLQDPDRSIELGFSRAAAGERPLHPSTLALEAAPLAGLATFEERQRAGMIAAAIMDSRTLVQAGRMETGGHVVPSPLELFPGARAEEISVLRALGTVTCGFERRGERVLHPLFRQGSPRV